jgi:hypothetical protein
VFGEVGRYGLINIQGASAVGQTPAWLLLDNG